ncbi:MAG: rhomboid family intramembrane serine protease [Gemmataceae bacterium]
MRSPPHLKTWYRFPVTSIVGLSAILVTLVWWQSDRLPPFWAGTLDVSLLTMNFLAWRGQPWRFVTSALPHINLMHIVFNLYWLWVFGTLVEKVFGQWKTALLLLLFAVGSSAAEYAIYRGGVGLSGVGYGLFGMLYILSREDERFEGAVDPITTLLFLAWFVLCCILTWLQVLHVGNVAHGMGLILGVFTGLMIARRGGLRVAYGTAIGFLTTSVLLAGSVFRAQVNFDRQAGKDIAYYAYQQLVRGRNETAARYYRDALAVDPSRSRWWYNLFVALKRMDQPDKSREALEKAVEQAPTNEDYQKILASQYLSLADKHKITDPQKAIEWGEKALNIYDKNEEHWYWMGIRYEEVGDLPSALKAYQKAATLAPKDRRFRQAVRRLKNAQETQDEK